MENELRIAARVRQSHAFINKSVTSSLGLDIKTGSVYPRTPPLVFYSSKYTFFQALGTRTTRDRALGLEM